MTEILLVAAALLVLVAAGGVLLLPWSLTWWLGIWITILGAGACFPTGLMYHVRLREELLRLERLQAKWYWSPVRWHSDLDAEGRRRAMPWFYAGGAAFFLFLLGVILILAAMVRAIYVDFA